MSKVQGPSTPVGKLKYTDSGWEGGWKWGYLHDEEKRCWGVNSKEKCEKIIKEWDDGKRNKPEHWNVTC